MGEMSFDAEGRLRWGRRAAGLLIQRTDNKKILLLLRSAEVMDPGLWGIPGGRVEPWEDDLNAAIRESEEELGEVYGLEITGVRSIVSGEFMYSTYFAKMPGAVAAAWTPELNWENDDWGWFSLRKLPKDVHPGVREVLSGF
jgi:8-oxo-dGTP pyrophosphatase MutT (NUDIX family)